MREYFLEGVGLWGRDWGDWQTADGEGKGGGDSYY
jgi:hypothetical protein